MWDIAGTFWYRKGVSCAERVLVRKEGNFGSYINCHFTPAYLLEPTRLSFIWLTEQEPSIYKPKEKSKRLLIFFTCEIGYVSSTI